MLTYLEIFLAICAVICFWNTILYLLIRVFSFILPQYFDDILSYWVLFALYSFLIYLSIIIWSLYSNKFIDPDRRIIKKKYNIKTKNTKTIIIPATAA